MSQGCVLEKLNMNVKNYKMVSENQGITDDEY